MFTEEDKLFLFEFASQVISFTGGVIFALIVFLYVLYDFYTGLQIWLSNSFSFKTPFTKRREERENVNYDV